MECNRDFEFSRRSRAYLIQTSTVPTRTTRKMTIAIPGWQGDIYGLKTSDESYMTQYECCQDNVKYSSSCTQNARGVGYSVARASALRSARILVRGFEPRHRRPGLAEGLRA
ncbi:hypothetical protein PoB_007298300 [Plakobranchus ocellatus]|uniref:Uncharacterized protein n=1 Tax=Plakobranchus ocellatus TaxID=259542 RepID=A0AAV4DQZ1_9GAST|nr:hypothetical protein PoB_007298300 [Plakobranchus ocellatus]